MSYNLWGHRVGHDQATNTHTLQTKNYDMTQKDELHRLVGAQYATAEEWRNNSRNNEEMP